MIRMSYISKAAGISLRMLLVAVISLVFAGTAAAQGRYVWVPDSLERDVETVLRGNARVIPGAGVVDPEEMVVYRGDTIPMILKSRNLGRFDRGLFNYLYLPKGVWSFGLTASYGEFSTEDLQLLDILSDVDISVNAFSIKPYLSYTIRNNLSIGMKLNYTRMKGDIGNLSLDFDESMSFGLSDIMYKSESYGTALTLTQYIGIARRGRFGVTNEVQLLFSSGSSDFVRPYDSQLRHTHTAYMDTRLTFSPGLSVFVMRNVSCNLSFGVFGFYIRNERQKVDGVEAGNRFTSGANFRFNIFNIAFGLAVHI